MSSRESLQEVIEDFSVPKFVRFLRTACSSFKPVTDDFSHYLDDDEPLFSDFSKIGHIEFSDSETLLAAAVKINNKLTDRTSKTKQYDLAKKVLRDTFDDAGLFLFYDDQGHFRLSLVCAQYMGPKRQFTTFRRYTYFVSPDLSNKTFLNQVGKCSFAGVDSILEAFSIEAVSNDFYNDFEIRFKKLASAVKGSPRISSQLREDFALLFAIRIIFLGFVQKRGWLGGRLSFIQDFWKEYDDQFKGDGFYAEWLHPLFFKALNSEPGTKVNWNSNDFSKETEAVLQMAPYLNGELFKEKQGVDDQELWLPDKEIGEFIDWLFQYNFTIEENDLYDEELELNPEFLGIIFERLVNKKDGAVYTPRPEVDLMCRLALLNWLDKSSDVEKRELYYQFFREGGDGAKFDGDQKDGNFSANEIRQLIELLEGVSVCDPAAGSGAFEVGMLHVINETLVSLYNNPKCPDDIERKDAFERKKAIIGRSLYGVEVKRWAVWINQLRLWLTLFIDMPDAMKNSRKPLLPSLNFKVRRGDSLVQRIGGKLFPVQGHADVTPAIKRRITELKKAKLDFFYNRGIDEETVKLLEYRVFKEVIESEIQQKQKEHDSLEAPKKQLGLGFTDEEMEQGHFSKLQEFTKKRQAIRDEIEELKAELKNLNEEHPLVWSIEFSEIFYDKGGFDVIIGNPPYVRQEDIRDPENIVDPNVYKELLRETINLDFPRHFKDRIGDITGRSDLFTYFYIRSLQLLNDNGIHVFICSNTWLDVGYGTWVQEFLLNCVPVRWIIDNHARRSFANADVNTIISVMDAPLRNGQVPDDHLVKFVAFIKPFDECIFTEKLLELDQTTEILKNDIFRIYPITNRELYDEGWEEEHTSKGAGKYIGDKWGGKYLRAPDIFFTILQRGKNKLVKLKTIADVRFGIKTGYNDFFYLTDQQIKDWKIEKEYLKPILKSPTECNSLLIDAEHLKYNLFICNKSKRELKGTNALKYIDDGETWKIEIRQGQDKGKAIKGVHNLSFIKKRKKWWSVDEIVGNSFWVKETSDRLGVFVSNKIIPADCRLYCAVLPKEVQLFCNSTIYMLLQEAPVRAGLGLGARSLMVFEVKNSLVIKPNYLKDLTEIPNRPLCNIFKECGLNPNSEIPLSKQDPKPLPDRKELDDIIFDALDLNQHERKEVYRAVCQLVWNRISKAKSVKKRK